MPFELKPHQRIALDKMHNGCILNGGVGVGKTITALAYYIEKVCHGSLDRSTPMLTPKNLLVITTARKRDYLDWEKEAQHFHIFRDGANSYGGVSITVDSWQNIGKYVDIEDYLLICDEQGVAGKGKWVKHFLEITKKNSWILLSATPADVWLDYVPVFIANGFYKNRTEFMDNHVVYGRFNGKYPQIRGYYGRRTLERYRDQILVDMPYERHTTRHILAEPCEYDKPLFDRVWKQRWNIYEDCPLIDAGEMHRVARELVNSDPSRLDAIERLSKRHDKLIVFYNFDYELELLRTLHTRLDIVVAEWNGHRHEDIPGTDRWLYLVQYQAGAEAWNCVETNAVAYYSLNYSHKIFEQTQGRIDRLNTPFDDLYYYVLMSEAKIDAVIWECLLAKKDFHEARMGGFKGQKLKAA